MKSTLLICLIFASLLNIGVSFKFLETIKQKQDGEDYSIVIPVPNDGELLLNYPNYQLKSSDLQDILKQVVNYNKEKDIVQLEMNFSNNYLLAGSFDMFNNLSELTNLSSLTIRFNQNQLTGEQLSEGLTFLKDLSLESLNLELRQNALKNVDWLDRLETQSYMINLRLCLCSNILKNTQGMKFLERFQGQLKHLEFNINNSKYSGNIESSQFLNGITYLKTQKEFLSDLSIDIGNNLLESDGVNLVLENVQIMTNLEMLNFNSSGNALSNLDEIVLGSLINLEQLTQLKLNFSNNYINKYNVLAEILLTESISDLQLDLSNNLISGIPEILKEVDRKLDNLSINLNKNVMVNLDSIKSLSKMQIKQLTLKFESQNPGNTLDVKGLADMKDIKNLEQLSIYYGSNTLNYEYTFELKWAKELKDDLKNLTFDISKIRDKTGAPFADFQQISQLHEIKNLKFLDINLDNTMIQDLQQISDFAKSDHLQTLAVTLSNNNLKDLEGLKFDKHSNLEELVVGLNDNYIDDFVDLFKSDKVKRMKIILNNNQLDQLSMGQLQEIVNLKNLEEFTLDLSHNYFQSVDFLIYLVDLTKLIKLNIQLANCGIKSTDSIRQLYQYQKLEHFTLNLSENNFNNFDSFKKIGDLQTLTVLNLNLIAKYDKGTDFKPLQTGILSLNGGNIQQIRVQLQFKTLKDRYGAQNKIQEKFPLAQVWVSKQ